MWSASSPSLTCPSTHTTSGVFFTSKAIDSSWFIGRKMQFCTDNVQVWITLMLNNFIIQASSLPPWGWRVDGVLKIQEERGKSHFPTPVATPPTPPFLWGIFPSNPALWCLYLHVHGSPCLPTSEKSAVLAKNCVLFSETTSWAWVSTQKHQLLHLLLHWMTDIRTHHCVTTFASMCRITAHRGKPWTRGTWKNCALTC